MAAALVLLTISSGAAAASTGPAYVALGDSRAAAPTWTSGLTGDGCGRTDAAYPAQVAAQLGVTYRSVACMGSKTENIIDTPQVTATMTRVAPQVDALSVGTQLVTLSIGGNDVGWFGLIAPCFTLVAGGDNHCRESAAIKSNIESALIGFTPKLDATLSAIHDRAPQAKVIVVGHGGYYGMEGCWPQSTAYNADARFVIDFFKRFNKVMSDAAARHGDLYVDVAQSAAGHDACQPEGTRWFEGNWPQTNVQTRHPTPAGGQAIAELVVAAV